MKLLFIRGPVNRENTYVVYLRQKGCFHGVIKIKAKKVPKFKAGKELEQRLLSGKK
jgi:hypothetical protein